VRSIKGASNRPLLVKIRAGNGGRVDVVSLARKLEDAGTDAFIFHARTAAQGYSGRSDWDLIRDLKQRVSVPVIGNGDVVDGPSAERALTQSGADGVALGRGTLGDPRIFSRIAAHLEGRDPIPLPTPQQRASDFLQYLDLALEAGIDTTQIIHQAQRFVKCIEGNAQIRNRLQGPGRSVLRVRQEFESLATS
jgi:tRNA-dihydrouridine synthase B